MINKMSADVMHLDSYDYSTLSKIYKNGSKQISRKDSNITKDEIALCMSAGHAMDLVDASRDKNLKASDTILDFSISTQKNIGAAIIIIFSSHLNFGKSEATIRNEVAKKVSSYLLFELYNYLQTISQSFDIKFDLATGIDFASGNIGLTKQNIIISSRENSSSPSCIDILNIGKRFSEQGIDVMPMSNCVGVNMNFLYNLVKDALEGLTSD